MSSPVQPRHHALAMLFPMALGLLASCSIAVSFDEYNDETWTVHGTVSGTGDAKIVFLVNDERFEVGDGPFASRRLPDGSSYLLTIETQPTGRRCRIAGGEGQIHGADVRGVEVRCELIKP